MRKLFIYFLVLFVWVKTFSQTDSKEIQNKVDLFDKYVQSSIPLWKTTGLSVAVVKDGKDETQSVLMIETTGSLTAEETVMTAIELLASKIKEFNNLIQSVGIKNKV